MGGWASLKTQETIITPIVVSEVVSIINRFELEFNKFIVNNAIQFIRPVGSATYYIDDSYNDPEYEYGDIDYLVQFPYISGNFKNSRDHENKSISFYKKKLMEFIPTIDYVDVEETLRSNGNYIIFKLSNDRFIQVDIIATLPNYTNWNMWRFTPEHKLKGVIIGALFSTINDLYNINIGDRGVYVRLKEGKFVSGNVRKNIQIITVSTDPRTYWKDLLLWIYSLKNSDIPAPPFMPVLDGSWSEPTLENIVFGLKGFIMSLRLNNLLRSEYFQETMVTEMIENIRDDYFNRLDDLINNPKYHKANSPKIEAKKELLKKHIERGKTIFDKAIF